MKFKHMVFFLGVALLLAFAAGCSKQTDTTKTTTSTGAFVGGKTGLTLSFLSGAPPDSVFDTNNPFTVNVKIENTGEWNVPKDKMALTITGVNPTDFGLTSSDLTKHPDDDLNGAQKDPSGKAIQGAITNIEFGNFQYAGTVAGQAKFNIKAEACYNYGTKAQTQLCISKDFLGRTGEVGVCNPSETKTVENSGAPVQFSKFSESVLGNNKISFVFDVQHVGDGNVYQLDSNCNPDISTKNKVKVTVSDPGLGPISCSGLEGGDALSGFVTLYEDTRSIRCTLTVDADKLSDYAKVLGITAEYDYKDSVDTQLTVKQGQ
jgi:hypothetical protein